MSVFPRLVLLYHATDSTGTSEWILVTVLSPTVFLEISPLGWTSANTIASSSGTAGATVNSTRRVSNVGYWRILAWL